ncbi:MAG: sigma-70 family RNA polymerase sigma factor [Chitinophagaceae bacterium]|nr:sigma-70 family RNA polymerase sigma factor [Chitinophagaceae bacterium]
MATDEMIDDLSVNEVITRILAGETERYASIVKAYDKYLYKIGRTYGFDHQSTEDVMQEVFVKVYLHLSEFEHKSSFKTWIVKIMLHECYYKKYRSKFRKETYEEDGLPDGAEPAFTTRPDRPEEVISKHELKHNLEAAILQMPEDYRVVFTMRELNDISVHDTAATLGLTENNVKVRLSRAKNMLRHELEKIYHPDEIFHFHLVHCKPMVHRVMEAKDDLHREKTSS